ncbi:MAG: protein-glutamate O-methyltransferase CheR [Candidatus Neomarinimicrobiota bacterium]|nr:MAG: protein-glutamate O-methyltransferase CheR [Candidatus Neomarinimicrobiota bacterium]
MEHQTLLSAELTEAQFNAISSLVKSLAGINLTETKKELVRARLTKRLRKLGLATFDDYVEYLQNDTTGSELVAMLDVLSTNTTYFFREAKHFEWLRQDVLPRLTARRRVRIWSAGCSSGEEPYSIAIVLLEAIPDLADWDAAILATDLSTEVLARARKAIYPASRLREVPPMLLGRHFTLVATKPERTYRVNDPVRRLVHFARLNLMGQWPMKGPFDVIFCRNVMIYFDRPTRQDLIARFHSILAPGGTLFIGHSESLTGISHSFRYVLPTVYRKPATGQEAAQ